MSSSNIFERLPPITADKMNDEQRQAADALAAGPRGGVKGPFIALLRSPELMNRLQRVGEYLRFDSSLDTRTRELTILLVARRWSQQFEWSVHYPLAARAGIRGAVLDALAEGRRPAGLTSSEETVYDFCDELFRTAGVSDSTYEHAIEQFGEKGVVDLLGIIGYFTTVSLILNVAHTPARGSEVTPLPAYPL
jgi:4-carboxymuconolactone decarboxylase